jgi:hypothetical protein
MRSGDAPKQETAVSCPAEQQKRSLIESRKPGSPPARFLVDVDGLGNMPSSQRLVGEQSLGRAERRCPTACCAP